MAYLPQIVSVPQGGTGLGTLTAHSVQLGNGTSSPTQLAVGATGTILQGSTGADPAFTATPTLTSLTLGAGSALSAYTTGTFTPTLVLATPGSSSFTYSSQFGRYTQVGSAIMFTIVIVLTNFTVGTGSGDVRVSGLPFTSANIANQNFLSDCQIQNTALADLWYTGLIIPNTSYATITGNVASSTTTNIQSGNITSTSTVSLTGWYSIS
jgi:hypothetical protein